MYRTQKSPDATHPGFLTATYKIFGGETGIRTLGPREGSTVFETAPFNRSGTSPNGKRHDGPCRHKTGGERGIRTLGTGLPYTRFPGELLQPLGHLSNFPRPSSEPQWP